MICLIIIFKFNKYFVLLFYYKKLFYYNFIFNMSANNFSNNPLDSTNNNYEILQEDIQNYDFSYKIIIVGNPCNSFKFNFNNE